MKWWLFLGMIVSSLSWSWVFILSDPLGADIFINEKLLGKTPYLLTNEPSSFSLTLAKPGYRQVRTTVKTSRKITNLIYTLPKESFHVSFAGYDILVIQNQVFRVSEVENLATGIYQFQVESNSLKLNRINPHKPWLYFSLGFTCAGLIAGTTGLILGGIEYQQFQSATSYEEAVKRMQASMFYDNLALWGYTFSVASGGIGLFFYLEDQAFQKQSAQFIIKKAGYFGQDKALYDEAMDLLSQKKTDMAIQAFERVVNTYPESLFVPPSLYQWAKAYQSQNNTEKAREIFTRLLTVYPVFDLYELTLYELFQIELLSSHFAEAEKYLNIMKLIHVFYSIEDTDWFELDLYRLWSQQDDTKRPIYQQKKEAFIHTRNYSPERRQYLQQEK
ncbi:MAG: tetratricopeptide repeat protein [Brevinematales bacterium]